MLELGFVSNLKDGVSLSFLVYVELDFEKLRRMILLEINQTLHPCRHRGSTPSLYCGMYSDPAVFKGVACDLDIPMTHIRFCRAFRKNPYASVHIGKDIVQDSQIPYAAGHAPIAYQIVDKQCLAL